MDAVDNATPMVGVTPVLDDNLVNFDTESAKVEEAPAEAVIMRSLEPPFRDSAPSQSAILGSPSKTRPSSVIATKNTRKRMEDRHVVLHDLKAYLPSALQAKVDSEEHVSYYAVFDGHAGTDAAAHAAAHLHEHLIESASYPSDPVEAFTEAFIKCDEEFVTKSKKSGTTAICSLIKGEQIFTAWLGDSQAVLIRNGIPVKIVEAHKPNREDERKRIEALGGTIMHWGTWRVNGQLAVSRAIGDGEYKPLISAHPDVTTSVNNGSDEFLIIGCDGLWDTVTPEEATEIVYVHLEENKNSGGDIENIGARLATMAKDKGSGDNITIIVVFIKPVEEVIALGRRNTTGQQPDMSGISTTCDHVRSGGTACTRDSLEPSKDKPDYTSPNVSFANLEGGQMFSPDPFGSADNGFNLSSEQFDNRIEDKRFSNESNGGTGGENFNGQHMDELLKQQSIAKVEDLFKMLDREDSSPTPEEEVDDRPLEEILAAAREQPQDEVDGVEDDDSSDDEVVDFGACKDLNEANKTDHETSQGNENLEQVLKLDDKALTDEQEETDTFTEDVLRPRRSYQEPTMDPCEQVTVKETGPQEYSTIVPPAQEMPSFQQPVIEIVDPMTCSMVKEESEQETVSEAKTNGDADLVSFDPSDEKVEGFMLKTPGQNGGEMLAQFSPIEEPETSVDITDDKVAPVTNALAALSIPEVAITPATPVKERSPAPSPRKDEETPSVTKEQAEEAVRKEEPKATPKKSATSKPTTASKANSGKPIPKSSVSKSVPLKKEPAVVASKTTTKPTATTKAPATAKSTTTTTRPTAGARSTTSATKTTTTRPTSATAGSRTKPGDDAKSTKSGGSTGSSVASGTTRTTPRSAATKPPERKPMPSKPDSSATRKPAVPRTDAVKTKPETKEAARLPPKRPTSSTLSKASSSASAASMSRQTSSASSASSSRPKPTTTSTSRLASASSRPAPAKTAATAGEETKKTLTSSRLANRASTSALRQTPAAAASANRSLGSSAPRPNTTLRRTTSATSTRAANSTTAVKPTAAAERVRAARAAAMSKAAPPKSKAAGTKKPEEAAGTETPEEVKEASPETVETKVNGHSDNNKDALNGVTKETGETVSPATEAGDSNPDKNDTQTLNGLSEVNQSEC